MNACKKQYEYASGRYKELGTDTGAALELLGCIPVSIHCWQLDDIAGFEVKEAASPGGGILSTGDYPGKARNMEELFADLEKVLSLVPGRIKINIHAVYGDFKGKKVDRDEILPEHFDTWIQWAQKNKVGLDFNPTLFGHPMAEDSYTLASSSPGVRDFWIGHVKRSRRIADHIGSMLGTVCINNIWIPDGSKDDTVTRLEHRQYLKSSLDKIFEEDHPDKNMMEALESKLFGIGIESYTAGSNEFYLSYAREKDKLITFDTGHFHPTELVSDKISAVLPFVKGILLHLSRGVRWDSDHVTTLTGEILAIMQEIVRAKALDRVYIGTDYFDGSINRVGALALGARTISKALLYALLEPTDRLKRFEEDGDLFSRLAFLEDLKTAPAGAVWEEFCRMSNVPGDFDWAEAASDHESKVLNSR